MTKKNDNDPSCCADTRRDCCYHHLSLSIGSPASDFLLSWQRRNGSRLMLILQLAELAVCNREHPLLEGEVLRNLEMLEAFLLLYSLESPAVLRKSPGTMRCIC
jgi:hypothetical protein